MKIFVTGGTGGLGRAVTRHLEGQGHQLTLLTRRVHHASANANCVAGDLLYPETYASSLLGHDAVLHLAAVTHTTDQDLYYAVNTRGTEALVGAATAAGVARFVYVSTVAVGSACGAYGDSKALAEDAVRASALAWTILRPAEVYVGPAHAKDPAPSRKNPGGEAVDRMIEAVRSWPVVPYVAHPRAMLAPVFRDDVIAAMAAALDCPAAVGKTYILAGPEEMTQAALAKRLMHLVNRQRLVLPVPVLALRLVALFARLLRLKHPPFVPDQISRLLCAKQRGYEMAAADLGFAPQSIEQTLAL